MDLTSCKPIMIVLLFYFAAPMERLRGNNVCISSNKTTVVSFTASPISSVVRERTVACQNRKGMLTGTETDVIARD